MATTIAINNDGLRREQKFYLYTVTGAWTAAETTGTVKVPFKVIKGAEISSNDTDAPVAHAISRTLSSGALAIARAAGGTAAGKFTVTVTGQ